jgi:hypothetical protein
MDIKEPTLLQVDLDPERSYLHGACISEAVLSGVHVGEDGRVYVLGRRLVLGQVTTTLAWIGLADLNYLLADCIGGLADEDLRLPPAGFGQHYHMRVRDDLVTICIVGDAPLPGVADGGDNVGGPILSTRHISYSVC